ncbi:hypothetical protein LCGC14_2812350 [marine sediment metagenome]|uniref:Peptide deformylase n=1 Tax=marine sediment metagenome TaxID=412755 RepID=A0A0F9ASX6_9ZZZZ
MIIKKLEDSLDTDKGLGLTAIQIGIARRVAIIRMPKLKLDLINPVITEKFDRFMFQAEKCLSIPGLAINTARYMDVTLQNGNGKIYSFTGLEAVVVQHELSHMNGRTIMDDKWRKRR